MTISFTDIERFLAGVTLAMPTIILLAHAFVSVSRRLLEYALTTPGDADDRAMRRIVAVAGWLEQFAIEVARLATLGLAGRLGELNRTPGLERYERQTRNPDEAP